MMVHVTIATQPKRDRFARVAVASLLNQKRKPDTIHIELNGFTSAPEWVKALPVTYTVHQFNQGARVKFRRIGEVQGCYITCDDDMIFPHDYTDYLFDALAVYGGAVGFHGTVFKRPPIRSYRSDMVSRWGFTFACDTPKRVHQLGTGCMAIHTDSGLAYADFTERNMADPCLTLWAAKNNVPLTCLTRAHGYIIEQSGSQNTGAEIWRKVASDDTRQTEIINEALRILMPF